MTASVPEREVVPANQVHNWSTCHFCDSWDVAGGHVGIEDETAIQEISCNRCGSEYTEVYRASHRLLL